MSIINNNELLRHTRKNDFGRNERKLYFEEDFLLKNLLQQIYNLEIINRIRKIRTVKFLFVFELI